MFTKAVRPFITVELLCVLLKVRRGGKLVWCLYQLSFKCACCS